MNFKGFKPEMVKFLFELSFNNTIEKQEENKVQYKKLISEPLIELYKDIASQIQEFDKDIITRQSKCISSMYTDRRFSPNTPFKEYMYIRFKLSDNKSDILGFYFDMGIESYSYGIRIYDQTSRGKDKLMDYAQKNHVAFEQILNDLNKLGYSIIGDNYVKNHYPTVESPVLQEFLNKKKFYIAKDKKLDKTIYSEELAQELIQSYKQLYDTFKLFKAGLLS